MEAVGIVAEYNPFHNGHLKHILSAKKLCKTDYSVAVMSGNFVQRGEPAIFDKWTRAQMAVASGVDLVIELPTVFSVRSAQYFATGAVKLLNALGIISHIAFGAETADLDLLNKAARSIDNTQALNDLRQKLNEGLTYAKAIGLTINKYTEDEHIHFSPNNILALEYLRAIHQSNLDIQPAVIKRTGSEYHDTDIQSPLASATAIRQALLNSNFSTIPNEVYYAMPIAAHNILNEAVHKKMGPVNYTCLSPLILYTLRKTPLNSLETIPEVNEGLHNKLKDAAQKSADLPSLLYNIKSKRYTYTRLQRILIHSLLGTDKHYIKSCDASGPLFIRILAFNNKGRTIIKEIRQKSSLPVITKITKYLTSKDRDTCRLTSMQKMLAIDTLATDIYSLCVPNPGLNSGGWDFLRSPIYLP